MAVARNYVPRLIPDGKGGCRPETMAEAKVRKKKEFEAAEGKEVLRIMRMGFTRQQAEYLRDLENKISRAANTWTPAPMY